MQKTNSSSNFTQEEKHNRYMNPPQQELDTCIVPRETTLVSFNGSPLAQHLEDYNHLFRKGCQADCDRNSIDCLSQTEKLV